ncbi:serine/threonine-protein kinase Nek6-like isoform X2 [Tachypleus tridentatus]|uniref:serine/threonine-protein kinase Nek6-like isoform X2 n=1 Tax=Tachypleus tridentatus TaxID=6853 RepID=UPI003FD58540
MNTARRLVILSSKHKLSSQLPQAVRSSISLVLYHYESKLLDDLIGMVTTELNGTKVESIAFIADGTESEMYLTANRNEVLSVETVFGHSTTRDFFCTLVDNLDRRVDGARLDFLACEMAQKEVGKLIIQELRRLTKCHVELSKDMLGSDTAVVAMVQGVEKVVPVGSLYFIPQKLQDMMYGYIDSHRHLLEYEKIRKVGSGAFGTAVLYRNKNDDSLVIWKEINMLDLNSWERQLSLNEVKVLSVLNHPNIICYFDSFEKDGILMIKMEYADGGNLAQYLSSQKTRIEEREIVFLFHQIVSAIHHLHEHNILHRDIKTSNIFLTKDGLVKVGDFGISKMLTTRKGKAYTLLGTPYYISPEMCQGKPYNEKSDIWALGCILYEMACLHKAFEGSNLPALGQFAPIREAYSNSFNQLVKDLLQKDPEHRPTAKVVLHYRLPELNKQFESIEDEDDEDTEMIVEKQRQTNIRNPLRHHR